MQKIGISSMALWKYDPRDAVRRVSELGFTAWEIVLEGRHAQKDYTEVKELANSYGIELFVHAPFSDLNIASLNERIRKETLSQIFEAVETAAFLESKIITLHSGRLSPIGMFFKEKAWETNLKSIREILEFGSDFDLQPCLENMPSYPGALCCKIDELREVLDVEPGLGVTLDIAHAHTHGDEIEYLKELKDRVLHVHLHDSDGVSDSHSAVGEGNIDFNRVMHHLKDFKGHAIIETQDEDAAMLSKRKFEEQISSL
ncbi:MAG: sugar phosphate isomerase/epimerase family protein [Candidatus Hydrothermarchaeaceae archaeon]